MSFLQPKPMAAPAAAPPPPKPTNPDIEAEAVAQRRAMETTTGGRSLTMLGARTQAASGESFIQRLLGAVSR